MSEVVIKDVTFDYEAEKALLQEIVAERGEEYVYERPDGDCAYFDNNGAPSCLVGHYLHRKGLKPDSLDLIAKNYGAAEVLDELGASEKVATLMERAQIAQDDGYQWGVALSSAIASTEEVFQ